MAKILFSLKDEFVAAARKGDFSSSELAEVQKVTGKHGLFARPVENDLFMVSFRSSGTLAEMAEELKSCKAIKTVELR